VLDFVLSGEEAVTRCPASLKKRNTLAGVPPAAFCGSGLTGCAAGFFEEIEMILAGPDFLAELLSALPKGVLFIADIVGTRFTEFDCQNIPLQCTRDAKLRLGVQRSSQTIDSNCLVLRQHPIYVYDATGVNG
jgi:hypothetical protein